AAVRQRHRPRAHPDVRAPVGRSGGGRPCAGGEHRHREPREDGPRRRDEVRRGRQHLGHRAVGRVGDRPGRRASGHDPDPRAGREPALGRAGLELDVLVRLDRSLPLPDQDLGSPRAVHALKEEPMGDNEALQIDGLEPQEGDFVVEKMRMSAWEGTKLEQLLIGLHRFTVIVTGAWTNMSIEHTARTGADKGYTMIVPEDGCSTINADWHNAAINYALQNVATVTNCGAVLEAIG